MRAIVLIMFFSFGCLQVSLAKSYLSQFEFLEMSEVKKKWGAEPFDFSKFKKASPENRAKMAYSLMKSKKIIGMTQTEVFKALGPSTGYFFSESVPAYIVGKPHKSSHELWQVVFLLSDDGGAIKEVRVHKKCCFQ